MELADLGDLGAERSLGAAETACYSGESTEGGGHFGRVIFCERCCVVWKVKGECVVFRVQLELERRETEQASSNEEEDQA